MSQLGLDGDSWLSQSRFSSGAARVAQTKAEMSRLLDAAQVGSPEPPVDADEAVVQGIAAALLEPLEREPAIASQAAEAAFTLATMSSVEGRPLNIVNQAAGDLNERSRLASDRTLGDALCRELLTPRLVPATAGPFQSSSYRAGYLAPQARSASLRDFAHWMSDPSRSISEVRRLAELLAAGFLRAAVELPPWPQLGASRLTFTTYRRVRDELLSDGSGGAFEQYLLAGLLHQEITLQGQGLRVETKNVGATDRSSGTAGDIQIRSGHRLVSAIEVTAANWESKVPQLDSVARENLREVVIAAAGVLRGSSGATLSDALDPAGRRLGIDPAVVDLHAFMDVAASRIPPHARAEAMRFVYQCLVRWHSREPGLATRLISVLARNGLVEDERAEAAPADHPLVMDVLIDRLTIEYATTGVPVSQALRDLADRLESQ